ncbi:RecQ family ATP-dependent DNA helicase [Teredinibacter sp. KSP-S5-2]|uniref:RecQ family ATP-dependent DNA helicase n=1 Tax=Teredinibacter sp. KSP-S5-2 TaxID=3034506 RepID=UPI002934EF58|nr:RecQ family ATP-dependent DNA helicase [Teredinibacter sp. KSP-S5-2]WNO10579.1 RecQ family ATP-dependent DNA helicase [Teredinibacter sp. KSP-S5-2]
MNRDGILSLDLEITKDGKHLKHLGAVLGDVKVDERKDPKKAIRQLISLSKGAQFILGHNILEHDLPWLYAQEIDCSELKQLPVIDTLFLSPLAFPRNPYHRLVKDYKIVKDSYNDPVADAKLSLSIFEEQLQAFRQQYSDNSAIIDLYHFLFSTQLQSDFDSTGLCCVMEAAGSGGETPEFSTLISECVSTLGCPVQLGRLIDDFESRKVSSLCLAYAVAWIQVAEGVSVLPPWVWRRFPSIKSVIKKLRETHCGESSCGYCQENFDAEKSLKRYFGFDGFHSPQNHPNLQKNIVEAGIAGESLLGILPTGGGKSLCYQLPAMIRNQRNASLTVIVSPLQALMKDQVDGLKDKTGMESVGALYGMLSMPERASILEGIRMGDIAILYLSPEQLRNGSVKRAIQSRQIGAWVFDEAHCLSKWGHDFRPDYLYCAKVIARVAREQNEQPPPIFCYTATAKLQVIEDICSHFKNELNIDLQRFEGSVTRDNLSFDVVETQAHNKVGQILQLLEDYLGTGQEGSCVIFCSTRNGVEDISRILSAQQSLSVSYFHGGLESSEKRAILDGFMAGEFRVVCATNAFGMGVDKDDVRLVIHHDIPGSLENYLQEAGRAGRDRNNASCFLLFDEQDIEQQFKLSKMSEIRLKDIREILKEIRFRAKYTDGSIVATSKELIRSEYMNADIDADDKMADTKIKTAISWLEKDGFLTREDNINSVFQGKPKFRTLDEAETHIETLSLVPAAKSQWLLILQMLMNTSLDQGINADDILDSVITQVKDEKLKDKMSPTQIMGVLAQMAAAGVITNGFSLTTYFRPKGKNNAKVLLQEIHKIEESLLSLLPELAYEDHDSKQQLIVDIRSINTRLINEFNLESSPRIIRNLLKTWAYDGKQYQDKPSIDLHTKGKDLLCITLNRVWSELRRFSEHRRNMAESLVAFLYTILPAASASSQKKVMVEFSLEQAMDELRNDMVLKEALEGFSKTKQNEYLLRGIERSFVFLDAHKVIELQNGMAVFKQAMELKVPSGNTRTYSKEHYRDLDHHYQRKIIQIHVMHEYARLGMNEVKPLDQLVKDYFELPENEFLSEYFKNQKAMLRRATSQESWQKIVTSLNNSAQQSIVHTRSDKNQLVLAGPGSGKTKVIVHRVAYLARVEQVPGQRILVLTFNHNAAVSLRKRIALLLGHEGRFVRVHTFHGLAMRLLGTSFDPDMARDKDFDSLIKDALALLKGDVTEIGIEEDHQRSLLLDGIEHILVDEYQDIDEPQYQMISALAGKNLDEDEKISLMAVGDDDQSIYGFRQANVEFIHQFEKDYQAEIHYLTQNYRSTKTIIEASNLLIGNNNDRMKSDHPIEINHARKTEPPGGRWHEKDPLSQGRVKIIECNSLSQQANEVLTQIHCLTESDPMLEYDDIAVLARNGIDREELVQVRSVLHLGGVPYQYAIDKDHSFSLHLVREMVEFREWLRAITDSLIQTEYLERWLPEERNSWHQKIHDLILDWQEEFGDNLLATVHFQRLFDEYLFEAGRQTRYGDGVVLSTVHGVKGEEFKQVIILGGDWGYALEKNNTLEEERRLFYVGMTRSIEQLTLMNITTDKNYHPHLSILREGNCHIGISQSKEFLDKQVRFSTIGMKQIVLKIPGKYQPEHIIHKELAQLGVGKIVKLVKRGGNRLVLESRNTLISRLSMTANEKYQSLVGDETEVKVIALIKRTIEQEQDPEGVLVEQWWLPIVELCY